MKKLGQKLEVSPATKRLWQELKQEMVSITTGLPRCSGRADVVSGVAPGGCSHGVCCRT